MNMTIYSFLGLIPRGSAPKVFEVGLFSWLYEC